jgi:GNAT superfamily N-acetyltransferase
VIACENAVEKGFVAERSEGNREMIEIRDPTAADEAVWRALWDGYVSFYEASVSQEVTAATWRRILDPQSGIFARLAVLEGQVIGFAIAVLHPGTWSVAPLCYLEDLFVATGVRGSGAGRALIEDLIARGRANGWRKLYWQTREDNVVARRLYDSFASADGFVRYNVEITPEPASPPVPRSG